MFNGRSVSFFGLGSSNLALMSMPDFRNAAITIRSDRKINRSVIPKGLNIAGIFECDNACKDIKEEIIFFSPSVRRERVELQLAKERGVIFSSDAEMFFEANCKPIFAISGSDGKSTTSTLADLMLKNSGLDSRLIGNIGEPMYGCAGNAEMFVCELSSFMLRYNTPKSRRACITNITPNHLDWHKDFSEYRECKISLLRKADEFVITDDLTEISGGFGIVSHKKSFPQLRENYKADVYYTVEDGFINRNGERAIPIVEIARSESYNLTNIMLAMAMTEGFASRDAMLTVARGFSGLEHRCEKFLSVDGVDYFDSSIDTSPARTCQTLMAFGRPAVVILGGKSKGLDYSELIPALKKHAHKVVITGENRNEIFSSLSVEIDCSVVEDFRDAIRLGNDIAKDAGALILSPASTSYDRFSDYRHRGNEFKRIIIDLHKGE